MAQGVEMRSLRAVFIILAACRCPAAAHSQPKGPVEVKGGTSHYRARLSGPFATVKPSITGAPYSAEQLSEFVETIANGTRVGHVWKEWLYRDFEGRVRVERSMVNFADVDAPFRFVQIVDQIAGYQYFVDPVNKVAHRITVPPVTPDMVPPAIPSIADLSRMSFHQDTLNPGNGAKDSLQITTESLGTRWIEGILARGTQTTMRATAASFGNDRPMIRRTEAWVSEELKVLVLSKREDAKHGDMVTTMHNYRSINPDPGLFRAPPDYTIVAEAGPFSVDIAVRIPLHGGRL